jgi:hypothetical protein
MMAALMAAATLEAAPLEAALAAADAAPIAIVAYRDAAGRPTGWPMTPYRDGEVVVLTSTLAFMRKTEAVRRDGRVAILAGGWLIQGTARVHADVSGDEFSRRFLDAELRKYPPARDIVRLPLHRWLFDWYFGRVFISVTATRVTAVDGSDQATLLTLDGDGLPLIAPIAPPPADATAVQVRAPDGPATILLHAEDAEMRDLRQLQLHGTIAGGVFTVASRRGSLAPTPPRGLWAELMQQREFRRLGREGRRRIEAWDGP